MSQHHCLYPSGLDHLVTVAQDRNGDDICLCATCGQVWCCDEGGCFPLCLNCGGDAFDCAGADGGECSKKGQVGEPGLQDPSIDRSGHGEQPFVGAAARPDVRGSGG